MKKQKYITALLYIIIISPLFLFLIILSMIKFLDAISFIILFLLFVILSITSIQIRNCDYLLQNNFILWGYRKYNNKDIPVYIANKIKISNSFLMGLYNEKIFVSKPTLDNLTSLQLEAVLGHELGHKYYKTSFINMIFALSSLILYYFSGKYISDKKLIILFSMIFIVGIITFISLRRTHEFLADKYSYKKLKDSSYLIEALSIMEETNKKNGFTSSRAIFHPKLEKRIKKLESYNV